MVRVLLEHSANPELASGTLLRPRQEGGIVLPPESRTFIPITPLLLAEESGNSKVVTLLREAAGRRALAPPAEQR